MRVIFYTIIFKCVLGLSYYANAINIKSCEQFLDEFSSKIGLNGNILVSKNDEILFEKSYGYMNISQKTPLSHESQFGIGSITKQFTAVAILKLVQDQLIALDSKIPDIILQFKNTPWAQNVTIEHLLTHTSGIYTPSPLENDATQFTSLNQVIDYLVDKPSTSKPGHIFMYSNNGYLVLGYIIEALRNKSLACYMKENFFDPLGMNSTYLRIDNTSCSDLLAIPHVYKDGGSIEKLEKYWLTFPFSAGGIVSTTHDLSKWNSALYNEKIISKNLLEQFLSPRELGYGLGIIIETVANGDTIYLHGGCIDGYQSILLYLPAQKTTICVLTNVDYHNTNRMDALKLQLSMMII